MGPWIARVQHLQQSTACQPLSLWLAAQVAYLLPADLSGLLCLLLLACLQMGGGVTGVCVCVSV